MERRFLVIDSIQLILVEPDTKRLGWGVVKFAGFLQVNLISTCHVVFGPDELLSSLFVCSC